MLARRGTCFGVVLALNAHLLRRRRSREACGRQQPTLVCFGGWRRASVLVRGVGFDSGPGQGTRLTESGSTQLRAPGNNVDDTRGAKESCRNCSLEFCCSHGSSFSSPRFGGREATLAAAATPSATSRTASVCSVEPPPPAMLGAPPARPLAPVCFPVVRLRPIAVCAALRVRCPDRSNPFAPREPSARRAGDARSSRSCSWRCC